MRYDWAITFGSPENDVAFQVLLITQRNFNGGMELAVSSLSTRHKGGERVITRLRIPVFALVLLTSAYANASIIVVDNGATLTTTYDETFVLTRDIVGGNVVHGIIFHNMFADTFTGGNPQNETYDFRASVNGGPDIVLSPWGGWNYRVGEDSPGNGWAPETSLGLLWNINLLGGAVAGDTVRLFGTMTHDKGGFHHLPDFAATTVEFSPYRGDPFAGPQDVSPNIVPEPASIAIWSALGVAGLIGVRRRRKNP